MTILGFCFIAMSFLPADFEYLPFAALLFLIGASFGIFSAPNTAAIMNALPQAVSGRRLRHALDLPERGQPAEHGPLLQHPGHRA